MSLSAVQQVQVTDAGLAVVRRQARQAELSKVVPELCGVVWKFVIERNLKPIAGRNVAVYLDGAINVEVGVEMAGAFEGNGEVVPSQLPAGPAATVAHFGPYNQMGSAHQAIHEWARANNRRLAGPSWEVYGHWQNDWNHNPSLIRTDVFYRLTE